MSFFTRACACLLIVLSLSACSGGPAPARLELPSGLTGPGLPFPGERTASATVSLLGREAVDRSGNAMDDGDSLVLDASLLERGVEWGLFSFTPTTEASAATVNLGTTETDVAYIGVANYAKGVWEFSGPHLGAVELPVGPDYFSGTGALWYAVLAPAGARAVVESVELEVVGNLGWTQLVFAAEDEVGVSAIAQIGGAPAIAYKDGSFLHYISATTPEGTDLADWRPEVTVSSIWQDSKVGLVEADGHPAVGCTISDFVAYMRSTTPEGADGNDWPVGQAEFFSLDTILFAGLAVADGHPAMCYVEGPVPNYEVKYLRASTPQGASQADWGTPVVVGSTTNFRPALAVIGGHPCVAFVGASSRINFTRSSTPGGMDSADWSEPLQMGSLIIGADMSLADIGGSPAMVFRGFQTTDKLAFVRSTAADGSAWPAKTALDPDNEGASVAALAGIGGLPAVAYSNTTTGEVRYFASTTVEGGSAADFTTAGPLSSVGQGTWPALAEVNGRAALSYANADGDLVYAILTEQP